MDSVRSRCVHISLPHTHTIEREAGGEGGMQEGVADIQCMPDEIMALVFVWLDSKTLLTIVPRVCTRWRQLCRLVPTVHIAFTWRRATVPAAVIAGVSELFPQTTSVAMESCHKVRDAHVIALADKCAGLVEACFVNCEELTDAAVLAIADKCAGLEHADFTCCWNLTDAAVVAVAANCPGLKHADFSGCMHLTDAAVVAIAAKCPGLEHADFGCCWNLTDAAVLAIAGKCRGLEHADFGSCMNLTDAAVLAIAGKCPGLKDADFTLCKLTDAAKIRCRELLPSCKFLFSVSY